MSYPDVNLVLNQLQRVTETSKDHWSACCPAHDDRNPSLTVSRGRQGIVVCCQSAGCTFPEICEAIGLYEADLFATDNGKPCTVDVYTYVDEEGKELFQVVRQEPKTFLQRKPNGRGGVVWNVNGVRTVPYNLYALANAPRKQVVYVVEGEKDADRLMHEGRLATCNSMGAGSWKDEHSEFLRDRDVVIIPDNDDNGRSHAQDVAVSLDGVAKRVRVLELPDLDEKGDVSDWLDADNEVEQLEQLLKGVRTWKKKVGYRGDDGGTGTTESNVIKGARAKKKKAREDDAPEVQGVRASTVERKQLKWLWPGRIPLGKLSMLVGDPGTGKSMLTLDMAARITSGAPWPDAGKRKTKKGSVIILSAEDDGPDTIVPRLDTAGADLTRVLLLDVLTLTSGDGMDRLEQTIQQTPDCQAVFIDPIDAYMAGVDSHRNADVRVALWPLVDLAARYGVAVIAVSHMNKSQQSSPMYRATGSLGFVAASRAVWMLGHDKADKARRLLLPLKCNLAPGLGGLAFRITAPMANAPCITWEKGSVEVDLADVLAADDVGERTAREEVAEWLADVLSEGRVAVAELRELARKNGHAWRTVERAKSAIRARSVRDGFGKGAVYYWQSEEGSP